jgi:hypothetical protein
LFEIKWIEGRKIDITHQFDSFCKNGFFFLKNQNSKIKNNYFSPNYTIQQKKPKKHPHWPIIILSNLKMNLK